jgi:hypothetical protein
VVVLSTYSCTSFEATPIVSLEGPSSSAVYHFGRQQYRNYGLLLHPCKRRESARAPRERARGGGGRGGKRETSFIDNQKVTEGR